MSLPCLQALHRHHVMAVPFEATDIHFGQRIRLEPEHIYEKVVIRRRGGFCYELNHLFSTLLQQLGFAVTIVSAEVNNEGVYGPPFDHMSIIVDLDGLWLADVGFGDLFFEPIRLQVGVVQQDRDNNLLLEEPKPGFFHLQAARRGTKDFVPKYRFALTPWHITDFVDQCRCKQESEESFFVQNFICTLPTELGRKTVRNGVFTVRRGAEVTELDIKGDAELREILATHFGLV